MILEIQEGRMDSLPETAPGMKTSTGSPISKRPVNLAPIPATRIPTATVFRMELIPIRLIRVIPTRMRWLARMGKEVAFRIRW